MTQLDQEHPPEHPSESLPWIVAFVTTDERVNGIDASEEQRIEWTQRLAMEAAGVIGVLADKPSLTELELLARKAAVLTYVFFRLQIYETPDPELLARADTTEEALVRIFNQGLASAERSQKPQAAIAQTAVGVTTRWKHPNLESFEAILSPEKDWPFIVKPAMDALREKLAASGVALPGLSPGGKLKNDDPRVL